MYGGGNCWCLFVLWMFGGIVLIVLIVEGVMYDWVMVYMCDVVVVSLVFVSVVYVVFLGGMVFVCFVGDVVCVCFGVL